jgi:medium-chain acyl-[acyl-carrier-protein] hydrolase
MRPSPNGTNPWLPYRKTAGEPQVRLLCFAHAGGAASVFRPWADRLPSWIDVCAVQTPGREARLMEKPFTRMESLMEALLPVLTPLLDRPFALFGYSLGAAVAWEAARRMSQHMGKTPACLFVCARRPPHLPSNQAPVHQLPEEAFKQKLRELGGTPEEALNNAELLELMLPILRADFELNDTFLATPVEGTLSCPIHVFGGEEDAEVSPDDLERWRESTSGAFSRRILPGGHFFLRTNLNTVLLEVEQRLRF